LYEQELFGEEPKVPHQLIFLNSLHHTSIPVIDIDVLEFLFKSVEYGENDFAFCLPELRGMNMGTFVVSSWVERTTFPSESRWVRGRRV
jgi:hypothetical protein